MVTTPIPEVLTYLLVPHRSQRPWSLQLALRRDELAHVIRRIAEANSAAIESQDALVQVNQLALAKRLEILKNGVEKRIGELTSEYKKWRASTIRERTVERTIVTPLREVPLDAEGVPDVSTLTDEAQGIWETFGIVVRMDEPLPGSGKQVKADPSTVQWRVPRQLYIEVWRTATVRATATEPASDESSGDDLADQTAEDANASETDIVPLEALVPPRMTQSLVLERRTLETVVHEGCDIESPSTLNSSAWAKKGTQLDFDEYGSCIHIGASETSVAGGVANALGQIPADISSGLDTADKIQKRLTTLVDAEAIRRAELLKRTVETTTNGLELEGLALTASDYALLKRLEQRAAIVAAEGKLAGPADTLGSVLADLKARKEIDELLGSQSLGFDLDGIRRRLELLEQKP